MREGLKWSIVAGVVTYASSWLVRHGVNAAYQRTTHREPPHENALEETSWKELAVYGTIMGAASGLARAIARSATHSLRKP